MRTHVNRKWNEAQTTSLLRNTQPNQNPSSERLWAIEDPLIAWFNFLVRSDDSVFPFPVAGSLWRSSRSRVSVPISSRKPEFIWEGAPAGWLSLISKESLRQMKSEFWSPSQYLSRWKSHQAALSLIFKSWTASTASDTDCSRTNPTSFSNDGLGHSTS